MSHVTQEKQHGLWFHLLDVVFNIVVIVAIVAGIRTFLVSPFQVEGSSMSSTLEDNEYIVINKLSYYVGDPQRGDVVVFRPPNEPSKYYVKRVIGLPGDEVILRDGWVYLKEAGSAQERRLEEEYLDNGNVGRTFRRVPGDDASESRFSVPSGHYFLLGDNRQGSVDSRSFVGSGDAQTPFVADEAIKGKVWFVALPVTKIHALEAPVYNED